MRPTTLRPGPQMPAMPASEPFGLALGTTFPSGVAVAEDDAAFVLEPRQQVRRGVVVALAVGDGQAQDLAHRRLRT